MHREVVDLVAGPFLAIKFGTFNVRVPIVIMVLILTAVSHLAELDIFPKSVVREMTRGCLCQAAGIPVQNESQGSHCSDGSSCQV